MRKSLLKALTSRDSRRQQAGLHVLSALRGPDYDTPEADALKEEITCAIRLYALGPVAYVVGGYWPTLGEDEMKRRASKENLAGLLEKVDRLRLTPTGMKMHHYVAHLHHALKGIRRIEGWAPKQEAKTEGRP